MELLGHKKQPAKASPDGGVAASEGDAAGDASPAAGSAGAGGTVMVCRDFQVRQLCLVTACHGVSFHSQHKKFEGES